MSFAEDSDYQLLDVANGSVVEMINNMDSNMMMLFGVLFVAVLIFAIKQCSNKKQKDLYTPINNEYGSVAVVN